MASDLNSVLKKYLAALGKNEASAAEVAKFLRSWVVENSEIAKERIEKQIEESVSRMGFVKSSDLDLLVNRISELENRTKSKKKSSKKSTSKNTSSSKAKSNSTSGKGRK